MATRLDDNRIVFAPVAPGAPLVDERVRESSPPPKPHGNLGYDLQRILARAMPPPKPKPVAPPPAPRFDPARCQATVIRVRALRALGVPHTVIEEMLGVPQRTSSDIATKAHGGLANPTDADLLEAGERLARWAIEKRR